MWSVRSWRWAIVAIAVVVLAGAVVIPIASSAGDTVPGNLVRARSEANRLLGLLHVPPGAVERSTPPAFGGRGVLGSPGYDEATPNLVDAHHWWTVRGKATQVLAYVAARLPRGAKPFISASGGPRPVYHMKAFSLPPIPGVMSQRVLAVVVVQLNAKTTAMRTDGEAVWIVPRPASEKVPAGVREIDIKSTAFMTRLPILAVTVTDRARVRKIVKWINAMGIGQPGSIACPDLAGPTVTFVFRDADGEEVARASGMDFDGTSEECNALDLRIRGRERPPLIGDFFGRVQRLLGVSLEGAGQPLAHASTGPVIDPLPSAHRVTVLDVLHGNGIGGVRFGASPSTVRKAIDSLLHQRGGAYRPGGSCGVDHQIKWWDQWTASGEPALTAYFRKGAFAGYQVGDFPGPSMLRFPSGGWALATTRGLRVDDRLSRGRQLYGDAFTRSFAQGGTWKLRTATGRFVGYAWGGPHSYQDVSWQSFIATIDAGDVGCPALSP